MPEIPDTSKWPMWAKAAIGQTDRLNALQNIQLGVDKIVDLQRRLSEALLVSLALPAAEKIIADESAAKIADLQRELKMMHGRYDELRKEKDHARLKPA